MARRAKTTNRVGLLAFRGLARLALREVALSGIRHSEPRTIGLRNHELILLDVSEGDLEALAGLRTVEDIFHVPLADVPLRTRRDLKELTRRWRPQHVQDGLRVKNAVFGRPKGGRTTYWVFVKADRDRGVKRKEIAEVLARAPASFSRWKAADPANVEIWGFHAGDKLTVGTRLTDNTFRHRRGLDRERKGALRPTIAAGMAVASRPRPDDVVLDPMCGTGTLLFERAKVAGAGGLIGFDIDPDAIELAAANLSGKATVAVGDATALPVPDRSVDAILCNLPFGRTFSDKTSNRQLYRQLRTAFVRVLKPTGRMVLLTNDMANFSASFAAGGLACRKVARVQVLGVWASMMLASWGKPRDALVRD